MPTPADLSPHGPALRPGALLLRRDAVTLQIGTAPGIRLRDRPGLVRVLRLLDGSQTIDQVAEAVARDIPEFTDDLRETVTRLAALGAVVVPGRRPRPTTVAVRHDRSTAAFADLLMHRFGPPRGDADLEVVITAGEPGRSGFEILAHAQVPHLPVVVHEERVRIGPLVIPGVTPCLGCLDAQTADLDPAWAALLPQFERRRLLPIAVPDAVLWTAAAEIARQIDQMDADERPDSVGHVVLVGPDSRDLQLRTVPFAPTCACQLLAS